MITRTYLTAVLSMVEGKRVVNAPDTYYRHLVERGETFTAIDVDTSLRLRAERRLQHRQCFYNAQSLALTDDTLTYYEGFANSIIPVDHAWLVRDGVVIDPTWISPTTTVDEPDYIGVPIDADTIRRYWTTYGNAGPILHAVLLDWPDILPL